MISEFCRVTSLHGSNIILIHDSTFDLLRFINISRFNDLYSEIYFSDILNLCAFTSTSCCDTRLEFLLKLIPSQESVIIQGDFNIN